jgi:hypothetical protein
LAPSAKEALEQYIAQITEFRPVVMLQWTVGAKVGSYETNEWRTLDPHWGIAFYDASDFPAALRIMEIEGIPFAYGFDSDHLLDGGTLHCNSEGKFDVKRSAI